MRTQAALSFAGAGAKESPQLGSQELNLLAADMKTVSSAGTNQPFFYEARVRAARGVSDARARIQLLTNALADTPARDDARIPLFQAAAATRSDELAVGVVEPLLRQQFLRPIPATASRDNEILDSETEIYSELPGELNAPLKIPLVQQAQVAGQLGEVLVRLDRLNEALPYMRLAYKLEKAPDRRKQIASRITIVRAPV